MGIKKQLKDKSKEELLEIIFRKDNVEKDLRGNLKGAEDKFNKYVEKSQSLVELSKKLVEQNDKLIEDNKKGAKDFNNLYDDYHFLKDKYDKLKNDYEDKYDELKNDYEDIYDSKIEVFEIHREQYKLERYVFVGIIIFLLSVIAYLTF